MAKLTDKKIIFANEYLVALNDTIAYKKAYPNVKKDSVAVVNGNRLLRNAKVKNYIDEQLNKIQDESIKDSNKCAELLGKRYRLFVNKVKVDVSQTIVFSGEEELED